MDPDTLLNCGRASPRLYRLVCDQEVWRHLLRGVDFTEERLEELRLFGLGLFGIDRTLEMMPEVVKEAAQRFALPSPIPGWVKVTISIQKTWGIPKALELDGRGLEELTKVAEAVGASFTITEVQAFRGLNFLVLPILRLIAAHLAQQEEILTKLEFGAVFEEHADIFWPLMQMADDLKKVWRMSEKFVFYFDNGSTIIEFGGGKGAETDAEAEAEWQHVLDILFEV